MHKPNEERLDRARHNLAQAFFIYTNELFGPEVFEDFTEESAYQAVLDLETDTEFMLSFFNH